MQKTILHNFRINGLEAISRLTHLAFSDPDLEEGGTPEAVTNRLHNQTRGRMRILTRFLRYRLDG
jgi:hypothetical protein